MQMTISLPDIDIKAHARFGQLRPKRKIRLPHFLIPKNFVSASKNPQVLSAIDLSTHMVKHNLRALATIMKREYYSHAYMPKNDSILTTGEALVPRQLILARRCK